MAKRSWYRVGLERRGDMPNIRQYMPQLLVATAESAKNEWAKLASRRLHGTANEYIRGLVVRHRPGISTVTLTGWLPNAIEKGMSPYDIKRGLLASPKAKRDAKGNAYMTVPLPLKAPGSGERGPSPPVMPWSVYKIASRSPMGSTTKLPLRLEDIGRRTRLSADPTKWSAYTWKTSPFSGIHKSPNPSKPGKARYNTFRRVSTKSDPSSWIHPGFAARHLADQVVAKVDTIFAKHVDDMLKGQQ
jgi:hypothetical protein